MYIYPRIQENPQGNHGFCLRFSQQWAWLSVFWDVTPCSPLKVSQRFGGTCGLCLQGWSKPLKNQREASSKKSKLDS
jgi:hypothetical protein